jgi:hypothetical protein
MGLLAINNIKSENMKSIFMSIWCILSISCFAQETVIKNEIHYKNVCFNGVCLGNDIRTMIQKWGKPDSTYIDKYNNDDNRMIVLKEYYYFDAYDHKKYMKIIANDNVKEKIIQFINAGNNKFQFEDKSTNQVISIDDDTIKLKKVYPLSYNAAEKFRTKLIREYTQLHQKDSQKSIYQTNKKYRQKIDKEYEDQIKWTNNIEITLDICCADEFYSDDIYGMRFNTYGGKIITIQTNVLEP